MKKRILVAPLNWGLGHATRCIPIIRELISNNFEPVILSDGEALLFLQKELPDLLSAELPSYNIRYAAKGKSLKLKLLKDIPKLLKTIKSEKKSTDLIIEKHNISGIISDNRFGVYSDKIPSVFITHQLQVLSGNTTWLSSKLNQKFIKNFDECWIPDSKDTPNLSGKLGHTKAFSISQKYIGALSRFKKRDIPIVIDILVLLSGPEPQRTLLETKLLEELKNYTGTVVFVKGIVENEQKIEIVGNMTIYNFMMSELLEKNINESTLIISRSGYTTIMDLTKLNKKAFFIPTPGQFEQLYLAERLTNLGLAPSCIQDDFTLNKLKNMDSFEGLKSIKYEVDFKELFNLF